MSSDVEGNVPCGWSWTTLSAIADLKGGLTKGQKRSADTTLREVPYLRVANVQRGFLDLDDVKLIGATEEEIADLRLQPGDVLFNEGGDRDKLGRGWVWRGELPECIHQNHVFRARLRSTQIEPKFISWYGNSAGQAYFVREGRQTTNLASLNLTKLGALPIPLPPTHEQHRIVAAIEQHFSRLDAAVAALRRVRFSLKRYRASVLKAACEGRLVPTEAELARAEGRDYEPADVLLGRILTERRAKWEADELAKMQAKGKPPKDDRWKAKYTEPAAPDTSALPELPEGWVWATWEQLSGRVTVGHVGPMKHEYVDEGFAFLRSQNVRENRFDPMGLLYIPPSFHAKLSKSVVRPGDLAVVRSGSVGVTCVIPESLGEANCADLVLIQRPNGVLSNYGAYYMNSLAKRYVNAGKVGIALTHFNTRSVASIPVALPPLTEQRRIVGEVERRLSVVDAQEAIIDRNLKRAERLRQAILKRAFEGKLVPQDPNDEPASVLLERIRAERQQADGRANGKGTGTGKARTRRGAGQLPLPLVGERAT